MRSLSIHLVRLILAMAACSALSTLVHAQEPEPQMRRPLRGWLGSGRTGPGEGQALTLTGRVLETFDDQQDTSYPDLHAGIRYDRKSRHRSIYVTGDTSSRRFEGFGGLSTVNHDVAAGFATSLGRRTRVQFAQSASRSPYYLVTVFAPQVPAESVFAAQELEESALAPQALAESAPPEPAIDYAVFRRKTDSISSALGLTHSLGRHTAVAFNYALAQSHTDDSDFSARSVGASFNHYLGRYAIARAGYTYRLADRRGLSSSTEQGILTSHDIDFGIDYNRPLSLSRRTTMVISTGSAIVPATDVTAAATGDRYRMLGVASLNHEMGRTWKAALSYGRNLEFAETLTEPLLSDNVALHLQGRFGRRLDLTVSANLAKGSVGFVAEEPGDHRYDTYSGSARLRWTINRLVKSYAEYITYSHAFGSGVQVPQGFGRDVRRSEIRVGLTAWAPLIR
jgi:hypothetical protein